MLDPIRPSSSESWDREVEGTHVAPAAKDHHGYGAAARGFHQRLLHLPLGRWVEVAMTDPHADRAPVDELVRFGELVDDVARDAEARARLRAVLDAYPAMVAQIRARVASTAAAARGFTSDDIVSRMTRVALCASLAIVARPDLADDEFARLYRPFERLIPINELPA